MFNVSNSSEAMPMNLWTALKEWGGYLLVWLWVLLQALQPAAAMGAAFGCVFFMAFPDPKSPLVFLRKLGLLAFSWGLGYAVGKDVGSFGMAWAVVVSALAATLMGALNLMVRNDGPLPDWFKSLLNALIRIKRGGTDDIQ